MNESPADTDAKRVPWSPELVGHVDHCTPTVSPQVCLTNGSVNQPDEAAEETAWPIACAALRAECQRWQHQADADAIDLDHWWQQTLIQETSWPTTNRTGAASPLDLSQELSLRPARAVEPSQPSAGMQRRWSVRLVQYTTVFLLGGVITLRLFGPALDQEQPLSVSAGSPKPHYTREEAHTLLAALPLLAAQQDQEQNGNSAVWLNPQPPQLVEPISAAKPVLPVQLVACVGCHEVLQRSFATP